MSDTPIPALWLAICTKDRPDDLDRLLSLLSRQTWPSASTVVIVDNDMQASAGPVVEKWRARFPVELRCVHEPLPGYATARNRALSEVPLSECICFLDDDAVVPVTWVIEMARASGRHPDALVRSPYAHLRKLPADGVDVDALANEVLARSGLNVAGASGLLIPPRWRLSSHFDPYFDFSGGEDTDLLFRLESMGAQQVVASTIAFEEQRYAVLPLVRQVAIARWSGRLAAAIRQRNGAPLLKFRLRAAWEGAVAITRAFAALLLGRRASFEGNVAFAACRWAMASAPRQAPMTFGQRVRL